MGSATGNILSRSVKSNHLILIPRVLALKPLACRRILRERPKILTSWDGFSMVFPCFLQANFNDVYATENPGRPGPPPRQSAHAAWSGMAKLQDRWTREMIEFLEEKLRNSMFPYFRDERLQKYWSWKSVHFNMFWGGVLKAQNVDGVHKPPRLRP